MAQQLSTLEILKWGREVMSNPATFTTGCNAATANGRPAWCAKTNTIDRSACRFCSAGFFWAVHQFFGLTKDTLQPAHDLLKLAAGYDSWSIIAANNRGQQSAVAMWGRAIKLCEQENRR